MGRDASQDSYQSPSAVDIEKSILASCLILPDTVDDIIESLTKDVFYRTSHQIYFEAIKYLRGRDAPADIVGVSQYLNDKQLTESAPIFELASLTDQPVSPDVDHHIRILREKYALRRTIELCNAVTKRCVGADDPTDTLEYFKQRANDIEIEGDAEENISRVSDLVVEAPGRYDDIASGGFRGLQTGFFMLDKYLQGLKNTDIMFLAARPSMGKTALALNIIMNSHANTLFFSLEQSKEQLIDRMIASEARINLLKFATADFDKEEWRRITDACGRVYDRDIRIDDTPGLSVWEIKTRARRMKRKYDIAFVVIDYIQLIKGRRSSENRNYELGEVCRELKGMAKELDLPVLALSQLNRDLEKRPNPHKRPKLSDLRESGEIEQVADEVAFIYRPEVYNDEKSFDDEPVMAGQAEIALAKHRQGPTGTVKLHFQERFVRFDEFDYRHSDPREKS